MPSGFVGSRRTPAWAANRDAAPSAAITNRARTSTLLVALEVAHPRARHPAVLDGRGDRLGPLPESRRRPSRPGGRGARRSRAGSSVRPNAGKSSSVGQGSSSVVLREWIRSPRAARTGDRRCRSPCAATATTARGVSPSPQTFSRGNDGLLDQGDVDAVAGEVVGGRRAAGPGADDQDVGLDVRVAGLGTGSPPPLVKTFTKDANRLVKPVTNPSPRRRAGSTDGSAGRRSRPHSRAWSQAAMRSGTTRRKPEPADLLGEPSGTRPPSAAAGTSRATPRSACASRRARRAGARHGRAPRSRRSRPRPGRGRSTSATRGSADTFAHVRPSRRVDDEDRLLGPHEPQRDDVGRPVGVQRRDAHDRKPARTSAGRRRRPRLEPASGPALAPKAHELGDLDQRRNALRLERRRRRARRSPRSTRSPTRAAAFGAASPSRRRREAGTPRRPAGRRRAAAPRPTDPPRRAPRRSAPAPRPCTSRSSGPPRRPAPGRRPPTGRGTARRPSRPASGRSGRGRRRAGPARHRRCAAAARRARRPGRRRGSRRRCRRRPGPRPAAPPWRTARGWRELRGARRSGPSRRRGRARTCGGARAPPRPPRPVSRPNRQHARWAHRHSAGRIRLPPAPISRRSSSTRTAAPGSHPRELRAPVGEEPLDRRVDATARVVERGGDDGRLGGAGARSRREYRKTMRGRGDCYRSREAAPPLRMTRFQKLTIATASTTVVLFGVGGLVRATDSGLGCTELAEVRAGPLDPLPDGQVLIEYSHRFVACVARRPDRAGRRSSRGAGTGAADRSSGCRVAAVPLVLMQAVLGGIVVRGRPRPGLGDRRTSRPRWRSLAVVVANAAEALYCVSVAAEGPRSGPRPAAVSSRLAGWTALVDVRRCWSSARTSGPSGAGLAFRDWPLMDGRLVPALGGAATWMFVHRVARRRAPLLVLFVVHPRLDDGAAEPGPRRSCPRSRSR